MLKGSSSTAHAKRTGHDSEVEGCSASFRSTTIAAGCNGQVMSTNHISSVPNLHTLARTHALGDSYSTGTQPPSGPNHWWLFSAQSSSSSQQQSYPTATGTEFDRFLGGTTGPNGEGTNACTAQSGTLRDAGQAGSAARAGVCCYGPA